MPKGDRGAYRFGIKTRSGKRSLVWRLWTQGNDVYLFARWASGLMKASLHTSGTCQISLAPKYHRALFGRGTLPQESRHFDRWQRIAPTVPGRTQCPLRIYVPFSELRIFGNTNEEGKDVQWLVADESDDVIEVSVVFSGQPPSTECWPGKHRGARILWHKALPSGETVLLVYLQRPLWDDLRATVRDAKSRAAEGPIQQFDPEAVVDLSDPVNRGIIGGEDDKGTRLLIEIAFREEAQQALK